MIAVRCSPLLATIIVAVSTAAAASDESLARAKDLYRSAAYDEALAALDRVADDSPEATKVEANEYRLFCLIALDRKTDARAVIESMVNANPFYQLTEQASPRVRTMFKDIRQSLLPGLVQREYNSAKEAFDKQDGDATEQFDRVLKLLDDPLITPTPALSDLRTVASGFRDLSKARAPKVEFAGATAPVVAQMQATQAAAPPSPAAATAASAAPSSARSGPPVYRDGDADVTAPVTVRQALPQWVIPQGTRPGAWQPEAIVEVTIDEAGDVINVILRKPFHPSYDQQLVKAAMAWKYEPARRAGVPVRYVKLIAVRLGG
jgi:TonB family protein